MNRPRRSVRPTTLVALSALAALALLPGCESLSDAASAVREKISAREAPHTRLYAASPRTTYEAVRLAAEQMGYRQLRGGAAQGQFDAISGLSTDDNLRGSRQIAMTVRLRATLDGGTELSVKLDEIIEADSRSRPGQGTATPLRDTPQYDVFLRRVQQALPAATSAAPPPTTRKP
ncbi:MAG: hypothetical protein RLZZ15_2905 [Verrucomicrobiota bacterium]|jgi:hypothetical protein